MSSPVEIAAGAAVEIVLIGIAAGILYRVWGKFLPLPKRQTVLPFHKAVLLCGQSPQKLLSPGTYWVSTKRTLVSCDMRSKPFQVPAQEVLTADEMGIRISLGGEYRIIDPTAFITESNDAFGALYLDLRHTLLGSAREFNGDAIMSGQTMLADRIKELLVPRAAQLGIEIAQLQVWEAVPIGWLRQV